MQKSEVSTAAEPEEEKARFVDKSCPRRTRFNAALLVLVTLGLAQPLVVKLPVILCGPLLVFLTLFANEFNIVHGPAMNRHKRAYFDVANVLDTYQPRARTQGHLFQVASSSSLRLNMLFSARASNSRRRLIRRQIGRPRGGECQLRIQECP